MSKTITLRLSEENYSKFVNFASIDNRSISNLIETLALRRLDDEYMVDDFEMKEILSNKKLLSRINEGREAYKMKRGNFVD